MPLAGEPCLDAEAVAAYASGQLSDEALQKVETHIDGCSMCRELVSRAADAAVDSVVADVPRRPRETGATEPHAVGAVVGRYVIDSMVGMGGMGVVYAAHDPDLGRNVALKALRKERFGADAAADEVLRREAMVMARLAHPNVVGIYDLFTADGTTHVAMEFVLGVTLREWLRRPRSVREIVGALEQAGRGLAAAHEAGIVHRDFKPENVMCDPTGRVRVCDFGLARLAAREAIGGHGEDGAAQSGGTATGVAGTPRYMAPEQRNGGRATASSDQFSFCVVLFEAVHGRLPVAGARQDKADQPQPAARGRLPIAVRQALARGLQSDPRLRYPSMKPLLADLTRDRSARWRRWGVAVSVVATAAVATVVAQHHSAANSQVCRGSEAKLVGVWDPARRSSVERAFAAANKPFAADAWRGVAKALDAYARDWVGMRTDVCEATRLRGEQSESLLDLRMACLDDRKDELKSLIDVLEQADDVVVARAFGVTQGLTRLAVCADSRALASGALPQQPDPSAAARDADLRRRITTVGILDKAGKYADALLLADTIVTESADTASPSLRADALDWRGFMQMRMGHWKEAEADLRQAARLADAAANDRVRARALGRLTVLLAQQSRFDSVAEPREEALAALHRVGRDADAESTVLRLVALAFNRQGQFDEARRLMKQVIDIERPLYGDNSWKVAVDLNSLASSYPADDPEGLEIAERSLTLIENNLGAESPSVADAEANIGFRLMVQDRSEDAEAHLRRALQVADGAWGSEHPQLPLYLDNLGHNLSDHGEYEQALPLHERALAITEETMGPANPSLFDSLLGIGRARLGMNQPRLAEPFLERALQVQPPNAGPATNAAEVRFSLARALDGIQPNDVRAMKLAREAQGLYQAASLSPRDAAKKAELDAWIARRSR